MIAMIVINDETGKWDTTWQTFVKDQLVIIDILPCIQHQSHLDIAEIPLIGTSEWYSVGMSFQYILNRYDEFKANCWLYVAMWMWTYYPVCIKLFMLYCNKDIVMFIVPLISEIMLDDDVMAWKYFLHYWFSLCEGNPLWPILWTWFNFNPSMKN